MIEINLLPGAKRRRGGKGKGVGLKLPDIAGLVTAIKDPWLVAAIALWAIVALIGGPLYVHRRSEIATLTPQLAAARRDSIRLKGILTQRHRLELRRDTLLAEIQIIRDIDRDRYIWPHLLDAVAKAVPDYTWLDDLASVGSGADTSAAFTIRGTTAGDAQSVTRFMRNLEDSPFVQGVTLVSSAMVSEQGHDLTSFTLNARYQEPNPSLLTMVPLAASVVQGVRSGGGARR